MKESFELRVSHNRSPVGITRKELALFVGGRNASSPSLRARSSAAQHGVARDDAKKEIARWRSSSAVVFNTTMTSSARICTSSEQGRSKSK
jgi:hypothetical protein